jgi:hypothetical protein
MGIESRLPLEEAVQDERMILEEVVVRIWHYSKLTIAK